MSASEPELVKSFVDADALSTWLVCTCELAQPTSHSRPQKKYFLQVDHDVDLTGYGRGQAKSVQQLWREVSHCPAAFAISKSLRLKPNAQSSTGRRRQNNLQFFRQSSNTVY